MFCPQCGKEVTDVATYCPFCGSRLLGEEGTEETHDARVKNPWENREQAGFFAGLFRTIKDILSAPSGFFRTMLLTGGLADPLLYALLVGMAGLTIHYSWSILLYNSLQGYLTPELSAAAGGGLFPDRASWLAAILTPFLIILWLFIVSGFLHVMLLMVRGAGAGFEATFRVVGYSITPFLCLAIPWCGMPITTFWSLTLAVIGLREAHGISSGKAVFAVLFPLFFCCGIILAALVLFLGAVAASFGSLMHLQ